MISLETERQIRAEWQRKADAFVGHGSMHLGYAHGYGVGNAHRVKALLYAEEHGIEQAAERFRVGVSSLYRWRQRADIVRLHEKLHHIHAPRRPTNGKI